MAGNFRFECGTNRAQVPQHALRNPFLRFCVCPTIDSKAILPYFFFMIKLTVTSKGQVTLRRDVLEHLGVGPGEQIDVTKLPDGRIEVRAASTGEISSLFGMLTKKGRPPLSIDEINEITKQGWSGKVDETR